MTISGIHTRAPGSAHNKTAPVSHSPATGKAHTDRHITTAEQTRILAEQALKPAPTKPASAHRVDISA